MRTSINAFWGFAFHAIRGVGEGMADSAMWHQNAYLALDCAARIAESQHERTGESRWSDRAQEMRTLVRTAHVPPSAR